MSDVPTPTAKQELHPYSSEESNWMRKQIPPQAQCCLEFTYVLGYSQSLSSVFVISFVPYIITALGVNKFILVQPSS